MARREEWKDIPGHEGAYQVSNLGRVRSLDRKVNSPKGMRLSRGKILKPYDNGRGYKMVNLRSGGGKREIAYVHRLVADSFVPNPHGLDVVDHIDHNRANNMADNLEWVTQKENARRSAHLMCGERRSWKLSSTGEKYIYKRGNSFRVHVLGSQERGFKTLDEAIRYRDCIRNGGDYMRADSIMQDEKKCIVTGATYGLDCHH